MNRFAVALSLIATLSVATLWAQDAQDDDPNAPLAESSAAQNVQAAALRARAPGNWVQNALAQHRELINARVNGPRFGTPVEGEQDQETGSGSDSSTGGTSSLGDLITQLTGSGALGSLANLFSGAAGLGGTSTATGAAGTLGNVEPSTGGANGSVPDIPPEALAMITAAGIDISDLYAKGRDDSASGGIARLPSKDVVGRAQSQDDRKFHARLVDSLLSTLFTALSVGLQTPEFIDLLKGFLQPVFIPSAPADTGGQDGGTADGGEGNGSTGGGGDGGGSGGGIEDLNPSGNQSDQGGSIVRRVLPAHDRFDTARVA